MPRKPYHVAVVLKHPKAIVSDVHLEPGAETPRHAHAHDYVVRPKQNTKLLKTTYKGGEVVGTEEITHKTGDAYYVAKSEDGTEFTIRNIGSAAMMCDKTQLPPRR